MSLLRRDFLQQLLAASSASLLPLPSGAQARAMEAGGREEVDRIRVRGIVRSGGRGVPRVGVSDGVRVVETGADGRFELVAGSRQKHVFLCVPAGYEIAASERGTARFFLPLAPDVRGEMRAEFELRPLRDGGEDHSFLYLADPQTETDEEMAMFHAQTLPDVRETVRDLARPAFGITCGDIVFDRPELYVPYEDGIRTVGIPFFQAVGNHDLDQDARTDEGSTRSFERHFGPRYYSFERGAVHYVVLDDVFWFGAGYLGYLPEEQFAWLAADLARVEPGRRVVVFMHIPAISTRHTRRGAPKPSAMDVVANREALYALLEPYRALVLSAHAHENEHVVDGKLHEHVHGAVCGAWWTGPLCPDGTPNGYAVYDVSGEEVRWRYKGTGLAADHQLRAYPHGADPEAPDQVVANVWDWDPAWKVFWYENGVRKGEMTRRTGMDPLARELYEGKDRPAKLGAVEPMSTVHLFYAPASRGAEVRVEAVDRWGRVYSTPVVAERR